MNVRQYYRAKKNVNNIVPFVFQINTANTSTGSTGNNQFKLPLINTGIYNFTVDDWGDGTSDTITSYNQPETTHTYPSTGIYNITISGQIEGWFFGSSGDRLKILDIQQWGVIRFLNNTNASVGVFSMCSNLTITATDLPVLPAEPVSFFRSCTSFTGNSRINEWDISLCTTLDSFFALCTTFNANIGNWNVSNVTSLRGTFFGCTAFNNGGSPDINNWNTSNVSIFSSGLNTAIFMNCTNFNQPLNNWDVSNATNFTQFFSGCTAFNKPLNLWNVSNATTMQNMFAACTNFNQNIGSWNVGNVTIFQGMFAATTNFNNAGSADINNWNTSSGQIFGNSNAGMFFNASSFNQPIGNWNMSSATSLRQMFQGATAFDQNIGGWNVSNVSNFFGFMPKTAATFSATNLDAIYNGWSALPSVVSGISISFGTANYTAAGQAGRNILTGSPNNWTITDGGI